MTSVNVNFPSMELSSSPPRRQPLQHMHQIRPHLPFRRISLPTPPSQLHHQSLVNLTQSDMTFADGRLSGTEVNHRLLAAVSKPIPTKNRSRSRTPAPRPGAAEEAQLSPRRAPRKRDSVRVMDDSKVKKQRKIIEEFYDTEKSYVRGLDLIYSHFLTPIVQSLESSNPLLNRSTLTSIFSNFIDIWNLHHAFLGSLTTLLLTYNIPPREANDSQQPLRHEAPPISPILLSHFPYLSLYKPFVTSFPETVSTLSDLILLPNSIRPNPKYNPSFANFLAAQEADPICGKLKLRDWLLSIVQRCPRYLLLLKDLITCFEQDDAEYKQLTEVHSLVSKITVSLNTNLHTHAQTLALLALQRATPSLPFQLIIPGRFLLKRGAMIQVENNSQPPHPREFLLFSDCLIWLASEDDERSWSLSSWVMSTGFNLALGGGYGSNNGSVETNLHAPPASPGKLRNNRRSKVNVEPDENAIDESEEPDDTRVSLGGRRFSNSSLAQGKTGLDKRRSYQHPPPSAIHRRASAGSSDEKYIYKGRAELINLEVVVTPPHEAGETRRFEILSPEGSFVVYTGSEVERDEWSDAIRQAKAQWLVTLNATNPNSTLTSSSSTNHIRRALQALPFPPNDARLATLRLVGSAGTPVSSASDTNIANLPSNDNPRPEDAGSPNDSVGVARERRSKVEHWVPAIWIPDEKTGACMRCLRPFGWMRRRHHCRLCGHCVCSACSGKTFFVTESTGTDKSTYIAARACDSCYESVFPLIESSENVPEHQPHIEAIITGESTKNTTAYFSREGQSPADISTFFPNGLPSSASILTTGNGYDANTFYNIPSHLSMPVLPVSARQSVPPPTEALMALDRGVQAHRRNSSRPPSLYTRQDGGRPDSIHHAKDTSRRDEGDGLTVSVSSSLDNAGRAGPIRLKGHSRPRSYHQILEDFEHHSANSSEDKKEAASDRNAAVPAFPLSSTSVVFDPDPDSVITIDEVEENETAVDESVLPSPQASPQRGRWDNRDYSYVDAPPRIQRIEDTARRVKRFSLPAVALQTLSVTAQTQIEDVFEESASNVHGGGGERGVGNSPQPSVLENVILPSGGALASGPAPAPGAAGPSRMKRFSLVLGAKSNFHLQQQQQSHMQSSASTQSTTSDVGSQVSTGSTPATPTKGDGHKGLAATKLMELLGRKKGA